MAIAGSQEVFKKISSRIESQFPGFVREEGPKFVAFLKAYFEYMEQSGNAVHAARTLSENKDIDRTVDSFVEYFRKEFMLNIPKSALADKRLLAKHIREFYRARGSQESYRFLFRAIFNKEIDFYYPGDDILRASDGRWVKEVRLRVGSPFSKNPRSFEGKTIRGLTSGATAYVQDVISKNSSGLTVYDLSLDRITGDFTGTERIVDNNNTADYFTVNGQNGYLVKLNIIDGGAYHNLNDIINISGSGSSQDATARITSVSNKSAVTAKIVKGGNGYTKDGTKITISGGNGTGFDAKIASYSSEPVGSISINTNIIGAVKNVKLNSTFFARTGNTSPVYQKLTGVVNISSVSNSVIGVNSAFTSQLSVGNLVRVHGTANTLRVHSITNTTSFISAIRPVVTIVGANAYIGLAGANVSSRLVSALNFSVNDIFTINAIAIINPGYGYSTSLPTISVVDSTISNYNIADGYGSFLGRNCIILANNATGAISSAAIVTAGEDFNRTGSVIITNVSQGNAITKDTYTGQRANGSANTKYTIHRKTFDSSGTAEPSGFLIFPGRYIDTKGFLSWNNRLQDNRYYQEFSYVIRLTEMLDKYKDIVKTLLHPAGTAMFGDYIINSSVTVGETLINIANNYYGSLKESITATAVHPVSVSFFSGLGVTESVTATAAHTGTYTANTSITESVTASVTHDAVHIFGMPGVYAKVQYANSTISTLSSYTIGPYASIIISAFDGSPRLVIGTMGNPRFANGALRANTGTISVGGVGSSIQLEPVGGSNTTTYNVNAIFSNTAFTIRTNYVPINANVVIRYSTY